MLTPLNSIFGESLFDDIFGDFTRPAKNLVRYNAPAPSVMKTKFAELFGELFSASFVRLPARRLAGLDSWCCQLVLQA